MTLPPYLRAGNRQRGRPSIDIVDHIFIIRALILRRLVIRYHRHRTGIILEFLRPAFVCSGHYLLFTLINKTIPPGVKMEQFVWAAFSVWFPLSQTYATLSRPNAANQPPFPGVSAMHMRFAIGIWQVFVFATFCYGSVFLMIIFGDNIPVPNVPLTALILLLAGVLGMGWGLCSEAISRVAPLLEPILHLLPWVMFITCGIYFSVPLMPTVLAAVFVYNPVLHLVEYERYAFDSGYPITQVTLWYPAVCAAGLFLLGLALNWRLRYTKHA